MVTNLSLVDLVANQQSPMDHCLQKWASGCSRIVSIFGHQVIEEEHDEPKFHKKPSVIVPTDNQDEGEWQTAKRKKKKAPTNQGFCSFLSSKSFAQAAMSLSSSNSSPSSKSNSSSKSSLSPSSELDTKQSPASTNQQDFWNAGSD